LLCTLQTANDENAIGIIHQLINVSIEKVVTNFL
jgi:hypothetical protein